MHKIEMFDIQHFYFDRIRLVNIRCYDNHNYVVSKWVEQQHRPKANERERCMIYVTFG